LGLGLYIVDRIARAHGGQVVVQSTDIAGTTFTVSLPRWAQPVQSAEQHEGERAANGDATNPRGQGDGAKVAGADSLVMVVDDEVDIREGIADLLRDQGLTVMTAANGAEALGLLRGDAAEARLPRPVDAGHGWRDVLRRLARRSGPVVDSGLRHLG
jgi:hypothetical protein